jgi:hypothetical protein
MLFGKFLELQPTDLKFMVLLEATIRSVWAVAFKVTAPVCVEILT